MGVGSGVIAVVVSGVGTGVSTVVVVAVGETGIVAGVTAGGGSEVVAVGETGEGGASVGVASTAVDVTVGSGSWPWVTPRAGGAVCFLPSSGLIRRRNRKLRSVLVDHDGRGSSVFKLDHCGHRCVGHLDAFAAAVRHDDMTCAAQRQHPTVAQVACHCDNSAHSMVSGRLSRP